MVLTGELFNLVSVRLFYHLMPEYGPYLQNCWSAICRKTHSFHIWTTDKGTATRLGHDLKRIQQIADLLVGIRMKIAIVYLDLSQADGPVAIHPGQIEFKKEEGCPYLTVTPQSVSPPS